MTGRGPSDDADARTGRPRRSIWHRLYHGETNFDFVGKRRIGFTISAVAHPDQRSSR